MSSARTTDWLLGLALAVAFSPGIHDLARQWWLSPWSRYSALFAALVVWLVAREQAPAASASRRAVGIGAIALAGVLQVLAVISVMPALARPALVLAALGFLWLRGLAPLALVVVAVWIVPVPHQLADWAGGDRGAGWLLRAGASLVNLFGMGVASGSGRVVSGELRLIVDSPYAGLPVLVTAFGLTCYAMLRLRLGWAALCGLLPVLVLGGALAQFLAAVITCAAMAGGSLWLAELAISSLAWLLLAPPALWWIEQRSGRTPATP